jgi:uncharacterized protein (TIGR03792 family)
MLGMDVPDGWVNDRKLYEFETPPAVEHLVYDVRASSFERWKAIEFEMWTTALADRSPGLLHKETWVQDRGEWLRISIVIHWRTLDDWQRFDPDWLDAQEAAFREAVGADNVRLVQVGHDTGDHYFKISEYR